MEKSSPSIYRDLHGQFYAFFATSDYMPFSNIYPNMPFVTSIDFLQYHVCFIKIRSTLSSVLLLCLLRIFMKQTLCNILFIRQKYLRKSGSEEGCNAATRLPPTFCNLILWIFSIMGVCRNVSHDVTEWHILSRKWIFISSVSQ